MPMLGATVVATFGRIPPRKSKKSFCVPAGAELAAGAEVGFPMSSGRSLYS